MLVEAAINRPMPYIWAAPTYDQSRTGMDETRKALGNAAIFNESRMSCTLPTGGIILYRSMDRPDNMRGKTAAGVVIDEAAVTQPEGWHEVLRPMLIDTNGWAYFIYTPNGRNWVWQDWQNAADRKDTALFHAPTLGVEITDQGLVRKPHPLENPFIPFDEIKNLYESMPERIFRQEILAEFVESGGGVFRNVRACATAERITKPLENHTYVAGLDWALSHDYTVLTVIDATDKALVYIDRFNGIDYSLQRERIKATCERFNVRVVVAEENAMGQPNNAELRRMGVKVRDFTTTATTKADIIEELAASFERGAIKIINDPILIGELEAYESERATSGGVKYGAPQGMHDDTVMSLAIGWSNIRQRFAYG